MKLEKYLNELDKIDSIVQKIYKQVDLINYKIVSSYPINEEMIVRYDKNEYWKELNSLELRILYFCNNYIENIRKGLKINDFEDKRDIYCSSNSYINNAIYNFDSFIIFSYSLFEGDQKQKIYRYLPKDKLNKFYPDRKDILLYWRLKVLRDRIVHNDIGRFDNSNDDSRKYQEFSSNVNVINIDTNGNIHMYTTLLDIKKSIYAQKMCEKAIEDRNLNYFDLLFPDKSAKGKRKNNPVIIRIFNDIFFDHIDSTIEIFNKILYIMEELNNLFVD